MHEWVLLIFLKIANAGGPATIEFANEAECSAASKMIEERFERSFMQGAWTLCIKRTAMGKSSGTEGK